MLTFAKIMPDRTLNLLPELCYEALFPRGPLSLTNLPLTHKTFGLILFIYSQSEYFRRVICQLLIRH